VDDCDTPLSPIVIHVIDLLDGAGVSPHDVIQVDIAEGVAWVWTMVRNTQSRKTSAYWLWVNGYRHEERPFLRRRTRYDLRELERAAG
jgi:hypothetical protein